MTQPQPQTVTHHPPRGPRNPRSQGVGNVLDPSAGVRLGRAAACVRAYLLYTHRLREPCPKKVPVASSPKKTDSPVVAGGLAPPTHPSTPAHTCALTREKDAPDSSHRRFLKLGGLACTIQRKLLQIWFR